MASDISTLINERQNEHQSDLLNMFHIMKVKIVGLTQQSYSFKEKINFTFCYML